MNPQRGLKLIHTLDNERYELYDITADPQETNDLISVPGYFERIADLKMRLVRIRNEDFLGLDKHPSLLPLSDVEIQNLRSLGYVR